MAQIGNIKSRRLGCWTGTRIVTLHEQTQCCGVRESSKVTFRKCAADRRENDPFCSKRFLVAKPLIFHGLD